MTSDDREAPTGGGERRWIGKTGRLVAGLAATATLALTASGAFASPHAGHGGAIGARTGGVLSNFVGFWDNFGNYVPRIHCLQKADGTPDWPWISLLLALNAGIVVGYTKIYLFWRRSYLAEAPRDRNRKLMDLAHIFLWCAVCGYALAILMFWWPAYRLNVVALGILNYFTWRFAGNLHGLRVSLSAVRLQRELEERMANHASELERLVAERTAELEQARAQAIAADRAKTNFLANMSHEIRTPMTAILGFTQILADRPPSDETQRQRYLQIVRQNGQHLLNVINDVLDMARIEAGQISIERIDCDLHGLLREVETLWAPKASEKTLTLALHIEPKVPQRVMTDPTRLKQVLFNLVGNAIKFTEHGGVTIDVRQDAAAGLTLIAIVDTGVGMTDEQSSRLFTRFAQADDSTTRRFGGSGLGLVISRKLMTMLGGTIDVRSSSGEGSRFTVAMPFESVQKPVVAPTTPLIAVAPDAPPTADDSVLDAHDDDMPEIEARPMLDGVRLLVVDDAADNRDLLRFLFERAGAKVEFAVDGRDAVDLVTAAPDRFDVILMDMHMPRLDGYAATTTLRKAGVVRPIVAVTANSMAGDRERCLAAGCDGYVSKPIDPDVLLSVVDRLAATRAGAGDSGAPIASASFAAQTPPLAL